MKKVLIAGGAGFIGSHLTEYFLKQNAEVWVIDNFLTGSIDNIKRLLKKNHFYLLKEDLNSINLEEKLSNHLFDIIYHLASPASPVQYIRYSKETLLVNSYGAYKLLEFAKKDKNTIFIYASTSEVYGDPKIHPQKENYWGNVNPIGVRACYDEAKRFGEAICMTYFRKYDLDIRIARIFNTYGPNMQKDDGRAISNFINQALLRKNIIIFGTGKQTRSFCYVSDLVYGLYLLSEKKVKGEVINLGNPCEKRIIDIARLIAKLTDSPLKIVFEAKRQDDPERRKPDIEKAIKLLNWQPKIPLEKGLKSTINFFKNCFNS